VAARHLERLFAVAPAAYLHAAAAAQAASTIVYAEGLGWLSRLVGLRELMAVVRAYFAAAGELDQRLAALSRSRLPGREELADLLSRSGRKVLCEQALGLDGLAAGGEEHRPG